MNTTLWVIQVILAAMFGIAGLLKLTQSKEKLVPKLPWVNDYSAGMVKFIGISEFLGAMGLIIPMLTGIVPVLTPFAATGICIIMVLASFYHLRKGEMKSVGLNAFLFFMSVFVALGRFH
jgi:hypothetical protein